MGWDALLDRFAGATVAVIGESCLDAWYSGPSRRLSREAPVPVVAVDTDLLCPGGAGNAAAGVAALGARARLVSVVGDDGDGAELLRALDASGVATEGVLVQAGRRTVAKRRVLSDSQLLVRFDSGDTTVLAAAAEREVLRRVREAIAGADVVLVADYEGGVLTDGVRESIVVLTRAAGLPLLVDAHRPVRWAAARPDVVKPDAEEVFELLAPAARSAFDRDRVGTVAAQSEHLLTVTGAGALVVTLDRDGALVLTRDAPPRRLHADPSPVLHTVGAGDSFSAALATAVAAGASVAEAAEAGCAAAAVVVRQPGTSTCRLPQLRDRLGAGSARLLPVEQLAGCTATHRALGRRVVMTNGCFDGLHGGHLGYLTAAKSRGDVLVVALNSDGSVERLRGAAPAHAVADRAAVLGGLACVDHVVVFDGDTPADLLRLARPDVWVKGGDYTEAMLPEAALARELGAEVRLEQWVDDRDRSPAEP